MKYPFVNRDICGYCGACVSVCPENAIELIDLHLNIDYQTCKNCLSCVKVCPLGAMQTSDQALKNGKPYAWNSVITKTLKYDVLVIGAGPAGSIAAKTAAEQGMKVLMVEKRQEIGSPVRCAEGVSKRALVELVDLDPKWISTEINGGRIYSPDGSCVTIEEPGSGLVLERKIFDRELAALSIRYGAEVWVKSRAIDLIRENGCISGAVIRRLDGDYAVHAKVVIAADGVESQVGRWAGISTYCKPDEVDTCAQYLIKGISINPNYCDFYLGHKIAPRGYAWIFPKGDDSANVGIGISGNISNESAIDYLNRFVEKKIGGGSILATIVGCVPVSGTLSEIVHDGLMIIGDAAHQNDPVSGGGIINSMLAGNIAGEVAAKSIKKGDVSRASLIEYERRWHKQVGRTFRHLRVIREGVLRFSDETLNDLARVLMKARKLSLIEMFWTALRNDPKLLLELRHLISMGWAQ